MYEAHVQTSKTCFLFILHRIKAVFVCLFFDLHRALQPLSHQSSVKQICVMEEDEAEGVDSVPNILVITVHTNMTPKCPCSISNIVSSSKGLYQNK